MLVKPPDPSVAGTISSALPIVRISLGDLPAYPPVAGFEVSGSDPEFDPDRIVVEIHFLFLGVPGLPVLFSIVFLVVLSGFGHTDCVGDAKPGFTALDQQRGDRRPEQSCEFSREQEVPVSILGSANGAGQTGVFGDFRNGFAEL